MSKLARQSHIPGKSSTGNRNAFPGTFEFHI